MSPVTALRRWAPVPIAVCALSIVVCAAWDTPNAREVPSLLLLLNTALSAVPFVVAALAARSYLLTGSVALLLLGCGQVAFGAATLLAGWAIAVPGSPNPNVTVHNVGSFLAALLYVGSGLLLWGPASVKPRPPRIWAVSALYGGIGALALSLMLAALEGAAPPFFVAGLGPTPLRQAVLGGAVVGFAMATFLFLVLVRRTRRDFLYWYALALGLVTLGLAAVFFEKAVGSPLGWAGRSAQYLGGFYFLMAVLQGRWDAEACGQPLAVGLPQFFRSLLEQQVVERTAALLEANTQLQNQIAEREKVEATLREGEAKYRSLVESSSDAILLTVPDGKVLAANAAACQLFGMTEAEICQAGRDGLVDNTDPRLGASLAERARTGRVTGELRLRRKDGSTFEAEISSGVFTDRNGDPLTSMVIRDVTARQRMEEELRTGEQRLRETVETLSRRTGQLEAIRAVSEEIARELDLSVLLQVILQRAADLVRVEGVAILFWDEAKQALVPQAWNAYLNDFPKQPIPVGQGVMGQVAATRTGLVVNDYRHWPAALPTALEQTAAAAAMAEPLLYRNELLGVIVVFRTAPQAAFMDADRDILQLFASQAAVAITNARLFNAESARRMQLETARLISAEMTRELDLAALLRLIAERAGSLIGRSAAAVWLWDEASRTLSTHAVTREEVWHRQQRIACGEGLVGRVAERREGLIVNDYPAWPHARPAILMRTRITAAMAEPLIYRDRLIGVLCLDNEVTGATFSAQDGTLLRLFADQAAIAIENARLFTELKQSLHDLREAQDVLVRTEKLRALGRMAAGIAHDLNNKLTVILGQAEFLRLEVNHPALEKTLRPLETATMECAEVVRHILEFGRQRASAPLAPLDLVRVVRETLDLTRAQWKDAVERQGATITIQTVLEDLPPVLGSAADIREALTNLILNAVEAMPTGGTLAFTGRVAEPGWIELAVADSGSGMPEEVRQRVFDPFFTTKGVQRAGLGLSVVYGIMERHGGAVTVASAPGEGTTFTLRFQEAPTEASLASVASPPGVPARRVLLIDDEALVRGTVAGLLRSIGHVVTEAADGAAGLAQLAMAPVDLVFTDLGMPQMSGWDVARQVKLQFPHLPVVLLTGWGEQAAEDGPAHQVDRILSKPVRRDQLLAVVAELTLNAPTAEP